RKAVLPDMVQHAEAKTRLGLLAQNVFGETLGNFWPAQVEHWLDEALPIASGDLDLIDWFYNLPPDHEAFAITRRRQSFPKLIENLRPEVQKIRQVRSQLGLNGIKPIEVLPRDDW